MRSYVEIWLQEPKNVTRKVLAHRPEKTLVSFLVLRDAFVRLFVNCSE